MNIPTKISPDRLRDAIIEIRYISNIPFEIAIGLFYQALDDSYTYTNRPISKQRIQNLQNVTSQDVIAFGMGQFLFYNKSIKIQLQPNSIIFNCINEYLGWKAYKPEIENFIQQISKTGVIDRYNRIGVRYISEYPNADLKECVKFDFTFGMDAVRSNTYTFHSEFLYEGLKVFLNLNHKTPVLTQRANGEPLSMSAVSLIDIDVIKDDFNIEKNQIKDLYDLIDFVHYKEKEIFFNLLKNEFLNTLNPEY